MNRNIEFETGKINPRGNAFDHHSEITHSNAFIAKMASVQLLEKLIITGETLRDDYSEVNLNHCGHMDDIVLHAIVPAQKAGKLRNLYAFASRVSALDSLGPSAYKLLQDRDRELVEKVYETFQRLVGIIAEERKVDRWKVELDDRISCSMAAGAELVENLNVDEYSDPVAWEPPEESIGTICKRDGIWIIEITDSSANPLRASASFYRDGCMIMIAYHYHEDIERYTYAIAARSPYDADLSGLWGELNQIEKSGGQWGGHAGAGGSPRKSGDFEGGSTITPEEVLELL